MSPLPTPPPTPEQLAAIDGGHELFIDGGGPDAVLLLHGLTGAPFEMHHLALRLAAEGYRCLAPVMAGHGGKAEDLVGIPWTEWVAHALRSVHHDLIVMTHTYGGRSSRSRCCAGLIVERFVHWRG